MNVLIIEDSLSTAMTLEAFVSACGYRPVRIPDALLASTVAAEIDVGMVLLDLVLPGVDGYELATRLRKQGLQAPIIAVTSLDDDPAMRKRYGIDAYLGKPASMHKLKALLDQYGNAPCPAGVSPR